MGVDTLVAEAPAELRLVEFAYAWRAEALAEQTLAHYAYWVCRLHRELPSGLLDATRSELAGYLSSITPSMGTWAIRSVRAWSRRVDLPDPSKGLRRPKPVEAPLATVVAGQVDAALADLDWAEAPVRTVRAAAVLTTLWASGMRCGELGRLAVADVDLDERLILIRKSKTGQPRTTIIDERATRWLMSWLAVRPLPADDDPPDDRVFPVTKRTLSRDVQRLLGLDFAPHSLRRGWAVHSLRSGISQVSVQAVAGWSSGAMCQRYVRASSTELAIDEFRSKRAS